MERPGYNGGRKWLLRGNLQGNRQVTLLGKQSQRDGIGSTVVVQTGFSEFQRKTVTAGNGQNQGSFELNFGLGDNLKVDFLRIFWPSGIQQTLKDVDANKRITVTEPAN